MPKHTPTPTPSRAVYGFVMYLSFRIFFLLYLMCAIIPENNLKTLGITFLPQRYWSLTIPIYLLTVLTFVAFVIYPSLGLLMTPHIDDMNTIKDKIGEKRRKNGSNLNTTETNESSCICRNKKTCSKEVYKTIEYSFVVNAIPILKDLEIWDVSDHLYLD